MKFFPFILRNLKRKKTRTILTVGSIAVALFLFGLLVTIETGLNAGVDVAGADRLVVRNRISLIQPLPLSYQQRLRQMPHVEGATHAELVRRYLPRRAQLLPPVFDRHRHLPGGLLRVRHPRRPVAGLSRRSRGRRGRQRYRREVRLEVGDRVPIRGTIFQGAWEFNVRAIYEGRDVEADTSQFWFHWAYLDERRNWGKGLVGWYTVKIDDPDNAVKVAAAIDDRFGNSAWETSTETEKAFAAGFAKQIGNIRLIVLSIGAVVLFTLLLVTGSAMSTAVRERIPELGVLKTLGFGDGAVLGLVLGESVLIALVGGGLGIGLAKLFTMGGDPTGGMLPIFYLGPDDMALGLALALLVGLLAGAIPAVAAMRLRIVDALRRV